MEHDRSEEERSWLWEKTAEVVIGWSRVPLLSSCTCHTAFGRPSALLRPCRRHASPLEAQQGRGLEASAAAAATPHTAQTRRVCSVLLGI